jgi:hypothetical protein
MQKVLLTIASFSLCASAVAADPVAHAQATSSPRLGDAETVSGVGRIARASVSTSSRSATATSSTSGEMSASATASGPGLANLTSGSASTRFFLTLEGPSGASLSGRLLTDAVGSGTVKTEFGNRGSLALSAFNYRFQTARTSSSGSIQWLSQAGLSAVEQASGTALLGSFSVTPLISVSLKTALGSVQFTPDAEDWLLWQLPAPQASLYPIESISMMSSVHADAINAIKRAIDLYGIARGTFEPARTEVGVGIDVAYSFQGQAGVELTLGSGRRDVLLASVSSDANATSGGDAESFSSGFAGGPSEAGPSFRSMRFEVDRADAPDLSKFTLRVDGLGSPIPIVLASPIPEPSTLLLWSTAALLFCAARVRRRV